MTSSVESNGAAESRVTAKVGLWFLLVADAMLFASLLFAAAVLRLQPEAIAQPAGLLAAPATAALTAVLISAAWSSHLAARQARRGASPRPWLLLAAILGLAFLAGQAATRFPGGGLALRSGPLPAILLLSTVFFATHVLAGVLRLLALAARTEPSGALTSVELSELFWIFLACVWTTIVAVTQLLR